jgi:hypothetical protein
LKEVKVLGSEEGKGLGSGVCCEIFVNSGSGENIVSLEGSQASLAGPFDKSRVKLKTLEWLEAVA